MTILRTYFRRLLDGWRPEKTALDEAIYRTFTETAHGQQTLAYLIDQHLMGFSQIPARAELEQGKAVVVQDLLARMDRYKHPERYGPLVEQPEPDDREQAAVEV